MSKETTAANAAETPLSLTFTQLQELIAEAKKEQDSGSKAQFKQLVEAIIESRKPYRNPLEEENEKAFRDASRQQLKAERENTKRAQDACPHVKGLRGTRPGSESAFWMHRLDTGETVGICCQCGKVISSLMPEDAIFFAKAGDNVPSGAGIRNFLHPIEAMTARFPEEERKKIVDRLNKRT